MSLPSNSIAKILREIFTGEAPIRVRSSERDAWREKILRHVSRADGVEPKTDSYVHESEKDRFVCAFTIHEAGRRHSYKANEFQLFVNDAGELEVRHYSERATVSSLREIDALLRACSERFERRRALAVKRSKVRGLKAHAIVARVKELGRELGFDFLTRTDSQKLMLYVKFSDDDAVKLDVPWTRFDAALPRLEAAITSLRALYEAGVRFELARSRQWPWNPRWISPGDD